MSSSVLDTKRERQALVEQIDERIDRLGQIPVPEYTDSLSWTQAYMRTERGRPLDFNTHPYMPEVIADRSPQKGFMCGSQVGKTTMAIAEVFSLCDIWPTPLRVIYTMHTDRAVQEFSQTRFKPAIQASPYLRDKIGGIDHMGRKSVRRRYGSESIIMFKGASVSQQALSEPADIIAHDELDFSRPDTLTLYEDRIAHSDVAWRRAFGTPTLPGFGLASLWDQSTQAEWLVKCPTCGDEAPIEWPASFAMDAADPHFICRHGHELTWQDHIRHGRWVRKQQDADWSMYRIPRALLEPWTAVRIVASFGKTEFPHLWLNQVMGQPSTSGDLTIDEAVIEACIGEQAAVTASDGPCFMGADPGAVIHYMIGRRLPGGHHEYIAVGHAQTWDDLHQVARLCGVRCVVIDGAYDPTKAREFVTTFPGRGWLAYYPNQPITGSEPITLNRDLQRVLLGRTDTLDMSAGRLLDQRDILPRCDYATHREMVSQLTAMVRGTKLGANNLPVHFWQEVRDDHLRHAHNYATVAATIMGNVPEMPAVLKGAAGGPTQEITAFNADTGREETVVVKRQVQEPPGVIDEQTGSAQSAVDVGAVYPALAKKRSGPGS